MALAMLAVTPAVAEEGGAPGVRFQLEGRADRDALIWLSGWLHAAGVIMGPEEGSADAAPLCVPPGFELSREELLEILNTRFAGTTVSPNEASAALLAGLREKYSCEEPARGSAPTE